MILVLNETPGEFGDDDEHRPRLLPVLQLDNAYPVGDGTRIRTASGDEFTVSESFEDVVEQVAAVLTQPDDEFAFDDDDGDAELLAA